MPMTSSPLIERLENDAYWLNGATHVWDNAPYEAAALIRRYEQALEAIVRGDHLRSQACDDTEAAAAIARSALRSKASTNDR